MNNIVNEKVASCHACNGTVSKAVKKCPHCGEPKPFRVPKKKSSPKQMMAYIGIGFVLMLPVIFAGETPSTTSSNSSSSELRTLCEGAIRASVNNPSTLDIHYLSGSAKDTLPDGTQRMVQTFSAKNSFGLELTQDAQCLLNPSGKFEFRIIEQGR